MEVAVHLLIYLIHTYELSAVCQAVPISLVVFKLHMWLWNCPGFLLEVGTSEPHAS